MINEWGLSLLGYTIMRAQYQVCKPWKLIFTTLFTDSDLLGLSQSMGSVHPSIPLCMQHMPGGVGSNHSIAVHCPSKEVKGKYRGLHEVGH